MEQKIGERQRWAWMACGMSAVAAAVLSGLNWLWVLLGGLLVGGYYLYIENRLGTQGLAERMTEDFGVVGKLLAIATIFWMILAMGYCAGLADTAFPMVDGFPGLGWVLLALAAWGCRKGARTCSGCSGILCLFLTALYGVVLLFSLPDVQASYLLPDRQWTQSAYAAGLLLLPMGSWYLPVHRKTKGKWYALLLPVVCAALCAVTAGVLSPELAQQQTAPLYELARSVSVLGVVERIEPLLSAAMTIGVFGLLSALACACQALANGIFPQSWFGSLCCVAAAGSMFLVKELPQQLFIAGNISFFFLFPVAITAVRKKV